LAANPGQERFSARYPSPPSVPFRYWPGGQNYNFLRRIGASGPSGTQPREI